MVLNNIKTATRYRRIFFIVSILIALAALALFLLDYTFQALGLVGVFSLWYLYFHVADYQFIQYSDETDQIVLRYYKAVRFGKPAFHSIEFPKALLRKVEFENSIFGKLSDVTFLINTKRGVAEYPSVSLSGISSQDRKKIQKSLNAILGM